MKVRIVSAGWETFTGSMGFGVYFEDGVSVEPLTPMQVRRIGCSLQIVDDETGEFVGPAAVAAAMSFVEAPVAEPLIEVAEVEKKEADERERLAKEAEEQKAKEAEALEAARAKAAAEATSVVYSRQELEAIGANDGIDGLRKQVGDALGVKGRSIADLVDAILATQAKNAAA